jgi:hypothetical protein
MITSRKKAQKASKPIDQPSFAPFCGYQFLKILSERTPAA